MAYVLGALVVLAALLFVAYPLLRQRRPHDSAREHLPTLAEQRAEIYRELLELEFDHRVGKLNDADFRQLSDACIARASALVDAEEQQTESIEWRVEREVALLRGAQRPTDEQPDGAEPAIERRARRMAEKAP